MVLPTDGYYRLGVFVLSLRSRSLAFSVVLVNYGLITISKKCDCPWPFGGLGNGFSDLESIRKFPRHCFQVSSTAGLSIPSDLSRGVKRSSLTSRLSVHLFNHV